MGIGEFIDGLIEPFAPRAALRRQAHRAQLSMLRKYDVADTGRRTQGWRRPATSADREVAQGLALTRNSARELVRNNKYAASGVRQIVANMVGDGITARATHDDPAIAKAAQDDWDRWAESRVDGRRDFYGVQKLASRAIIEGGEALLVWSPDADGPDGRVRGLEGDYLDHLKNDDRNADGRIVQGVQFDGTGDRSGYWLFDHHPGDVGIRSHGTSMAAAQDVDHVFEELRWGQTRGISWFAPIAMDLRDVADIEDAVRMRRKVEACVALVLTSPPGEPSVPKAAPDGTEIVDGGPAAPESLRPGMVLRARPGETATTVNPATGGDSVAFVRQQLMGIAANLAPYHLLTGDASQSNYTSLRACLLGFWANLDDWQWNMLVPDLCAPAFSRRMNRLAITKGDRRFRQVKAQWAMPPRRLLNPLDDMAGEEAEIRAGLKSMPKALSERGINWQEFLLEVAAWNKAVDDGGHAFDTDPRRITDAGMLQAAQGYVRPKNEKPAA